jgi:hypothetical protein
MQFGDREPERTRPLPERGGMDCRILGKVFAMTQDTETTVEPGSVLRSSENRPSRKRYEGPQLKEWGSILELTGAFLSGENDVDNLQTGSEGV